MAIDMINSTSQPGPRMSPIPTTRQDEVLVKLPLSHVLSADFCQRLGYAEVGESTIRSYFNSSHIGVPVYPMINPIWNCLLVCLEWFTTLHAIDIR